jgi:hypothetical protein
VDGETVFAKDFFAAWFSQTRKTTFLQFSGSLKHVATLLPNRVTRLGEYSPNGRLFTLGSFFENRRSSRHFWNAVCTV